MATHRVGVELHIPASADVFFEPSVVKDVNDRYPHLVLIFNDTATKISCGVRVVVPKNYIGTVNLVIIWETTATTGNAVWDFDYTAVATAESLDPSADQQSVTVTTAASGTARNRIESSMALTAGNLAIDDVIIGNLSRDGASADTIAAALSVEAVFLEYNDS